MSNPVRLGEIVKEAYDLFSNSTVSKPLDVCHEKCCLSLKDEELLIWGNLQNLSGKLLSQWNHAAKTKDPHIEEFKHFLPRLLDLTVLFEWPAHSTELSLKSFLYYETSDWTQTELKLFDDFALTYFDICLNTYPLPDFEEMDAILIMLDAMPIDTCKLLDSWTENDSIQATLHFADFLDCIDFSKKRIFRNAFSNDELEEIIRNWLKKNQTMNIFVSRFEEALLKRNDLPEDVLQDLSYKYELLQNP